MQQSQYRSAGGLVAQGTHKQIGIWKCYITKQKKKHIVLGLNSCLAMLYLSSYFYFYFSVR